MLSEKKKVTNGSKKVTNSRFVTFSSPFVTFSFHLTSKKLQLKKVLNFCYLTIEKRYQ